MSITYDTIGENYNRTRNADPYLTDQLLQHLQPEKDGLYLDIGCGTGNYTNEFQKRGFHFIGIDPSKKMLNIATLQNPIIDWRIGFAENTGLPSNSINGIIGSLTIHHWADIKLGFEELWRVLKPKGKLVLFTSTPRQMKMYWLNHYFPKMLFDSIKQMPTLKLVKSSLDDSQFKVTKLEPYFVQEDLKDQFLYCGKQKPELYFDKHIRHGISSFSSLSNREEVENGLTQLKHDINSGSIQNVMKSYHSELGDYLFIVASKGDSSND